MVRDEAAAAEWQFGALEGLAILRHAKYLRTVDIERMREAELVPGRALFGEQISETLLRAAQLRVFAD
jgi:hypothetical protein